MKEVNSKLNSSTAGISYSVNVVVLILANLLLSVILVGFNISKQSDAYKYLSFLCGPVAIVAGCLITMKWRKQSFRDVVSIKCRYKYYIIALLMYFGLLFSVSELNTVFLMLLESMGYKYDPVTLPSLSGGLVVPVIIVAAVLPALFEEFLFRGVILTNVRNSVGDIRAIFIVGFCFSLFHGSPEQTIYQFICGCAFALIAIRSGSLIPGIVVHFLNNATIIVLDACGALNDSGNLNVPSYVHAILIGFGAIAFISSIIWLALDKKPLVKREGKGVSAFFICATVGIIVLAVMWIAALVIGFIPE